jgi:hypothetical protein
MNKIKISTKQKKNANRQKSLKLNYDELALKEKFLAKKKNSTF